MSREEISELLESVRDEKLLIGNPEKAVQLAREAYELAGEPNVLGPWRKVAAYRLAHLMLRAEELDESSLQQILDLLREAAGEGQVDAIGPLPLIYQLPVYTRLLELRPESADDLKSARDGAFEWARRRISFSSFNRSGESSGNLLAQSETFNLLEIACYFMGANYSILLGLGSQDVDIAGSWCILSNRDYSSSVRYNQRFGCEELDAILKIHPEAVAFRQLDNLGNWEWWTNESDWTTWPSDDRARMIAMMLADPRVTTEQIARALGSNGEAVRQTKRQLFNALKRELPHVDQAALRLEALASADSEISLFMVVQLDWLRRAGISI